MVIMAQAEGRTGFAAVIVRASPIASVSVTPATVALVVGGALDLEATGRVSAVAAGTSTITATVDGKSGPAQILVTSPVVQTIGQVVVSPSSTTILLMGPSTVRCNFRPSCTPLIATVSATGLVTALAEGTAIIRATSGPKSGTSTIAVVRR